MIEELLTLCDILEDYAERCASINPSTAEPWVARRLLIDAAAACRGAANQLHKHTTNNVPPLALEWSAQ